MEEFSILVLAQTSHGLLRELSFPVWTFLLAGVVIAFEKSEVYWPSKIEPCTQDILCGRQGARHRKDCIGKIVNDDTFIRRLRTS